MAHLSIDKEEYNREFKDKNWEYIFKETKNIINFILENNYKILDENTKDDLIQECLENLWYKIQNNKIKNSDNLFGYVWKNSSFKIRELFRISKNKNKIAQFVSIEKINDLEDESKEQKQIIIRMEDK